MKVSISSFTLLTVMMLLPLSVKAAGHVTFLNVDNDAVYFATAEIQAEPLPSCVIDKINSKYAVSLNTETGRAIYSLLITAMASKQAISVASAGDCDAVDGVQRATGLSIVPTLQEKNSGLSMYLYKGDGLTKLGRILSAPEGTVFKYFPVNDNTQVLSYSNRYWLTLEENKTLYFSGLNCDGVAYRLSTGASNPTYVKNFYFNNGGLLKRGSSKSTRPRSALSGTDGSCRTGTFNHTMYLVMEPYSEDLCGNNPCIFKEE